MKKKTLAGALAFLMLGATIVADQYDVLFLKCNGTTTSFVDSSTANPKTITANGNATQLPIKFNKSAGFFNGTSDYLDIANSTDFAFGTGAFTIEGFFNTGIAATAQTILDTRTATANTTGLLVNIINSTGNKLCVTTATTARITGTTTLAKNTWYHFMVVGNGGANGARTIILYLDGVQEGSTYTNDYNFTDQTLRIGAIKAAAGTYMKGWMKELRISSVARTVAVPTAQYKSDANTKLLMHFDTPATSPLAPAIAFDGTGDYLDFSDSADFAPGTGAFTVEGFINTTVPATDQTIFDTRTATANTTGFLINIASSKLCFTTATTARITGGTTLIANRTYHWRVVGNGGADGARTVTLYLNGQVEGTAYTNNYNFTDQTLRIGSIKAAAGTAFNGWMREIRFSNSERNTSAFTPSQTGFTVDANTKLYIKGNEDNGSPKDTSPIMTAANLPSPAVVDDSDHYSTTAGWRVFDRLVADGSDYTHQWISNGTNTGWIRLDLGAGQLKAYTAYAYTWQSYGSAAYPTAWTFDGSQDGTTWTTLDTQTGQSFTTGAGTRKFYSFTNTTAYRWYRINITAASGTYINCTELELFEAGNYIADSSTTPKTVSISYGDTKIKYTEDYRSCIFKDETGKFPYPVGSAKVDFFAIGSGVGYFDGSTSYLTVANHADIKMGTGDYSAEGYGRLNTAQNNTYMLDMAVWPSGGWCLGVDASKRVITVNGATNSNGALTTGVITLNTWFHLAQVRSSGVTKVYLNGSEVYSVADTYDFQQTRALDIGDFFYTYNSAHYIGWAGLLDNIRISKGVARYTATFNPPADFVATGSSGRRKTNWFWFF